MDIWGHNFWIIRLAVLAAIAMLLANLANTYIAHLLWNPDWRSAPASAFVPRADKLFEDRLPSVVEKNIFQAQLDDPSGGQKRDRGEGCSDHNGGPWHLVGTVLAPDEARGLAVLTHRDGHSIVLSSAQELEGTRALSIGRETVVIEVDDACTVLKLGELPGAGPAAPARGAGDVSSAAADLSVRRVGADSFEVRRADVERVLTNLHQLRARIFPIVREGRPLGFKISAIQKDSPFRAIGIENGDLVRAINGYELNDPSKMLDLFSKLKDATTLTVDITRAGQPHSLRYEIRK